MTTTQLTRQSLCSNDIENTSEYRDKVVLPTGEVIETKTHFIWNDTRYEIQVNGSNIHFIRNPSQRSTIGEEYESGDELVTWIDFDTHDEFRDWCIAESEDLTFNVSPCNTDSVLTSIVSFVAGLL